MLYHLVPRKLAGQRLLPLADLRSESPDLHEKYSRKYAGREQLLQDRVPGLGCLWSEVLFFTALTPAAIRELHEQAGIDLAPLRWFEVDPELLDVARLQIYWYHYVDRRRKFEQDNWCPYNEEMLSALRPVPLDTREHYRQAAQAGQRPFAFFRTPHVLYKGHLELSGLPIVTS